MTTRSGNGAIALTAAAALAPWLLVPAVGAAAAAPAAPTVQMAPDTASAQVLAPGVHQVAISDQAGYFAVERTIPGSTLWVGETVVTANPGNGDLLLAAVKENLDDCGWSSPGVVDDLISDHEFRTGVVNSGDCTDEDVVYIRNEPGSGSNFSGETLQVAVWEEPPVADAGLLPPASAQVRWDGDRREDKGRITLGSDFASAPDLSNGSWQVRLYPGRTALAKVPLEWGQHLQATLSHPGYEDGVGFSGKEPFDVEPRLITPLGGEGNWAQAKPSRSGSKPPINHALYVSDYPRSSGAVSPVIQWKNRTDPTLNPAAFPGTYYVSLRIDADVELPEVMNGAVDVTLDIGVFGEPATGSPYAQTPADLPDFKAAAAESAGDADADDASDPSEPAWGVVGGLGAIAVGMTAAGGALLVRWRRLTGRAR